MMDFWENYSFIHTQKFLIKLHEKLNLLPYVEHVFEDGIFVDDRIEIWLNYFENELRRYGMFNKYEFVPSRIRRKQLIYLLAVYLNQAYLGAGDACSEFTQCPISISLFHRDRSLQVRESVKELASLETEHFPNFYIQYQLYSGILRKIYLELNGTNTISDPVLNALIIGLCIRLQKDANIQNFLNLPLQDQRTYLLKLLATKITEKCNKITLEDMIKDSSNGVYKFSKEKCKKYPKRIWENFINIGPSPALMTSIYNNYPLFITEIFLELLAEEKEKIIIEQESIFRNKVGILKKEIVETIQTIKEQLNSTKSVDKFLNTYKNKFKISYNITENEFYRQEILKNDINKVILEIKKTTLLTDLVMKEVNREIEERANQIEDLTKFIDNICTQYQQCIKNKVDSFT